MATVVNDLVTKFSFQGTEKPLDRYNTSLGSSIKLLAGFVTALNAAGAAFTYWANGQLKAIDSQAAVAHQTGVSVAALQEWSYAAEQSQSSAQAVQSTFQSLTTTIGQAAQKGSEEFARLGISVRDSNGQVKSADRILAEVAQRFKQLNLSLAEQRHFAESLGIDPSLLQLLNKTGGELAALRKEARDLGVLTPEQAKQAEDYTKSVNSMWYGLNAVKELVAVGVAPEMARLADEFVTLLKNNKDWIVEGIRVTVKWIGNILAAINRLLPVFALMAVGFGIAKIATLGWAGAMGILFSPVVVITTGIVALLAIVDDLIVAFRGGQSVIADFFKDAFDIDIVKAMTSAFDGMKIALGFVIEGFRYWWEWLKQINDLLVAGGGKILQLFGIGGDEPPEPAEGETTARRRFAIPPVDGVARGGTVDNRQVNQSNTVNVYSNDAQAAGRAVQDNLQRQLDDANTQLAPGGR